MNHERDYVMRQGRIMMKRTTIILALTASAVLGTACDPTTGVTVNDVCLSTVASADADVHGFEDLISYWGVLDYDANIWRTADGTIIGTSLQEDSAICVIREMVSTGNPPINTTPLDTYVIQESHP